MRQLLARFTRVCAMAALIFPLAALTACEEGLEPVGSRTFVIEVSGERFTVRVTDPVEITKFESRKANGQVGVISGKLVEGDGGFNSPWSWHLDPASVHAPDLTVEVCDGRPSMVEADLQYWITNVVYFCPWGASVIEAP